LPAAPADAFHQLANDGVYHDLPRGEDGSKAEFIDFLEGWVRAGAAPTP
jgi:hypothetical protein